ncbi:MAG: DNA polymerase III subunit alpha [Chitinophagales bacterium]|nr:DNA polymerase III subunit alpha [Chitinophagales bacterium]
MPQYSHLHCHTQFSLLDGAASIPEMIAKAKADGQGAVAITDHGNMFGAFKFVAEAKKQGIKPIIGCEFYVVEDRFQKSFTGGKKDKRYHQLILAKNEIGYKNLSKLCSLGYIDGLYSKWPRIDKELIKQYSEGLIATTCCIGAEVPQAIINLGEEKAEKVFLEWLDVFGEDYYIELQRHNLENIDGTGISQEDVNQVLLKWSEKYKVPAIATNDSHYIDEMDANAHDILLCVNTGELKSTPIGKNENFGKKGTRFGFPNSEFFFKTTAQMEQVFKDIPHVLENTQQIVDKVNTPDLKRDILLPNFTLPQGFDSQAEYLHFLTYEGAKKRYGELTDKIRERLDFELKVINDSGYPGYFLIVQDFTTAARKMGVGVGPGRGSAAGSAVAYCIGITNVDPIKYELLFERFLNPERVSMPDIDIDFDDEGRQKVIDFVVDKYGKNQVAQIITYGSMAAKMSLRDVGRVLDVPLSEVDKVAKAFPDHLSATLNKVLEDDGVQPKLLDKLNTEQKKAADDFRALAAQNNEIGEMIREAKKLEGSIRNTGIHACGVIITPEDITNFLPMTVAKDSDLLVTQFDNSVVESAGLLKMDFLGLKTLTIIKDAIEIIKQRHGIEIIQDDIPLDDEKAYQLFQKGLTNGIFQFESPGMKKHLRSLKPDKFADIIAMNALYRPGPMEYIPNYIARKHGKEKIEYDLPEMEEFLEETYGITVYQEQVMLLSQKLAGFTKGQADSLRKAMGKKIKAMMDELYPKFIDGCLANGHDKKIVEKIWKDWEAFAEYAFNKSHSTCYGLLAYQTAYLKANYPAEFMAAVLGHNMNDIKKVTFFMDECKRLKIPVLGPDVNESSKKFTVNKKGKIRFALSAIKGVGGAAVDAIIEEREANGVYADIFDLTKRVNLRAVNKKSIESLAIAGSFDGFENSKREHFIVPDPTDEQTLTEKAIKFGSGVQASENSNQNSLFGDIAPVEFVAPPIHKVEEMSLIEKLNMEKKAVGIYITGHPLDTFKLEVKSYTTANTSNYTEKQNSVIKLAGIITSCNTRFSKKGTKFCVFTMEDYNGSMEVFLFGEDYIKFGNYVESVGSMVFITGRYELNKWNNQWRFNISNIDLLENVKDKYTNGLKLEIKIDEIDENTVDNLTAIIESNPGNHSLNIDLINPHTKEKVSLYSKSKKIDVTQELLEEIEDTCGIKYKLT